MSDFNKVILIERLSRRRNQYLLVLFVFILVGQFYYFSQQSTYSSSATLVPNNSYITRLVKRQDFTSPNLLDSFLPQLLTVKDNKIDIGFEILADITFFCDLLTSEIVKNLVGSELLVAENIKAFEEQVNDGYLCSWRNIDLDEEISIYALHEQFLESIQYTRNDFDDLFVITFKHQSPLFAQQMLKTIIQGLNERVKSRYLDMVQREITNLELVVRETEIVEVKKRLFDKKQRQMIKLDLLKVEDSFMLQVIDPPSLSDKRSSTPWLIVIMLSLGLGLVILCAQFISEILFIDQNREM